MFLWVAAEEQGLLGSAAYAAKPLWPAAKDGRQPEPRQPELRRRGEGHRRAGQRAHGPRRDGGKHRQGDGPDGGAAKPDLAGGYFRSDHFSFAKAGVPAFSVGGGHAWVEGQVDANDAKAKAYGARYHQVNDEYDPSWDLSGMVQQAQFTLNLGRMVADTPKMPQWKAGDAFGKVRAAAK
jgi:Zn-dependent M28 family amino/carboxypeptidase